MEEKMRINYLINRYVKKEITSKELAELHEIMQQGTYSIQDFDSVYKDIWNQNIDPRYFSPEKVDEITDAILSSERTPVIPIYTKNLWKKLSVAAGFLLIIGLASWFLFKNTPSDVNNDMSGKRLIVNNSLLEIKKADPVLTLADGREIILGKQNAGMEIEEEGVKIKVSEKGEITYEGNNEGASHKTHHISVPKGGKYKLKLGDGTEVTLNSSSKLTYPLSFFRKKIREVKLDGEAYFEVKRNEKKNFIVDAKDVRVRVLGTGFNVRAYKDETKVKTTLFHGNIIIENNKNVAHVKPGEQAVVVAGIDENSIKVEQTNVSSSIAWQKGEYVFVEESIQSIMKQMERWYNIEVEYKFGAGNTLFTGSLKRTDKVSDILEAWEMTKDISFEVKGNKIIVYPGIKHNSLRKE